MKAFQIQITDGYRVRETHLTNRRKLPELYDRLSYFPPDQDLRLTLHPTTCPECLGGKQSDQHWCEDCTDSLRPT